MNKFIKRVSNRINHAPVVTVLPLHGIVAAQAKMNNAFSDATLADAIEKAFKPNNLCAVVLAINCPGGSPAQSNMIVQRIRKHANDKNVPVLAFCEDVAASGGYMLACAADEIYVDENSILGSIGVISAGFGAGQLMEKIGVERRVHTSGERKAMLDPFSPQKEEDVVRLKEIQSQIHDRFIDVVKERRGAALKADDPGLFNGDVWVGQHAVDNGLADAIGHQIYVLEEKFGKSVDVRVIEHNASLWKKIGMFSGQNMSSGLFDSLEQRTVWQHYGC